MSLNSDARTGLLLLVVGTCLLVNVGHLHLFSPGGPSYDYERVNVSVEAGELRFTADGGSAVPPETLAGVGCDGLTDRSSDRLCRLDKWLLNGSGPIRTATVERTDPSWTDAQRFVSLPQGFYERTELTHRSSASVSEDERLLTLTPVEPAALLDAIAVPIEDASPGLRRIVRRGGHTTDHYVTGAGMDTRIADVTAAEWDDAGTVVETDDGYAVTTLTYGGGAPPPYRFLAGGLQWTVGLALVAVGGHRYLANRPATITDPR